MSLMDYFDSPVVLDIAVVSTCREAIEIGAVGHVGRIPEVVVAGDILPVEDAGTPLVVDVEAVDGVAKTINEVLDDEAVIDAVTVGGHHIGELEEVIDEKNVVGCGVEAVDHIARGGEVVGTPETVPLV